MSTPPGHGLIVGLLSGAVLGLVGGWITLVGLPLLSRPRPSGPGSSAPMLPLSSEIPTRGGPTVGMGLLALLAGSLVGRDGLIAGTESERSTGRMEP